MSNRRSARVGRAAKAAADALPLPAADSASRLPEPAHPGTTRTGGAWQLSIPHWAAVFPSCLAGAFLYLLCGPYSNFASTGYLDPWFYTGYFLHFSYLIRAGGATYYVSRLPWILPGLLVSQIARPEAAAVILNALIIAVSASAIYFIVSWYYGKWPGILAAIAVATNPYFIFSVSWDYPDGPAIAYAMVALAFFLRPKSGRLPNSFAAGFFLAFSGYTNLAGIFMLIALLAIPLWRHKDSIRGMAREMLWTFSGGVAATLFLAPFGKAFIGQFTFYRPQLDQIRYVLDHPGYLEHMWGTGNAWIPTAYRLAPFLFAIVVGSALMLQSRKRSAAFMPAYLAFLSGSVLFVIGEFVLHNVGLRCSYGTTYMLAPMLAFAGLAIGECWPPARRTGESAAPEKDAQSALFCGIATLFGMALPLLWRAYYQAPVTPRWFWTLAAVLAAAGIAAALFTPFRRTRALCLFPCCLVLAGLAFGPASDQSTSYPLNKENVGLFREITDIAKLVDSSLGPDRLIRFWYDQDEPSTAAFHSTSSLYLWGYVDCTSRIAAAPAADLRDVFNPKTTFVHLTMDPSKMARRQEILAGRGVVTGNQRHWTVPSRSGTIHIFMEDVVDMTALH